MIRCSSRKAAVLLYLTLAMHAAPLRAQDSAAQGKGARAIEHGNEGATLYEQGKWNEALERFREAESLYHSPVFVLYTARSLRNAGRLIEARETFRRLVNEALDASAPDLWKQAQADGREELAAVEANIPSAVISVVGGSPNTRITVDDRTVVPGQAVELDPGAHRIVAIDSGRSNSELFTLAAGARGQRVVVQLAASKSLPSRRTREPLSRGQRGISVPGLVVASVGGVAIATGAVIGVVALHKKSEVEDDLPSSCDGTTCPRSKQIAIDGEIDSARKLGTVADVLLIGGVLATGVGVSLLIFAADDEPTISAGVSQRGGFVRMRF